MYAENKYRARAIAAGPLDDSDLREEAFDPPRFQGRAVEGVDRGTGCEGEGAYILVLDVIDHHH